MALDQQSNMELEPHSLYSTSSTETAPLPCEELTSMKVYIRRSTGPTNCKEHHAYRLSQSAAKTKQHCSATTHNASALNLVRAGRIMDQQVNDQSVTMEDLAPPPLTDEQCSLKLKSFDKEVRMFSACKDYISEMLESEKRIPSPKPETTQKMGKKDLGFMTKIKGPGKGT
ncbi:hypothetical protein TNIN_399801 [Trichonephila inaurata madagascariensis]|uniref:Uncharacterized protein n=1 Tax=Trichonephila inaurata madagascariensis TaxID=2747483 RepID=A0A8X6XWH7_9ARAC|nr:hypothetical protein TNIN_399801 [Trichonephila inaurata madagascariensis]